MSLPDRPNSSIIVDGYAFPATFLVDPETGLPYLSFPVRVPATGTFPVSGHVAIDGTVPVSLAAPVAVSGTVPVSLAAHVIADAGSTFPISGTVAVSAVAAPVSIAGTVPVSGTVAVSAIAAPVPIAGTVPVSVAAPAPVNITTPPPISANTVPTLPVSNVDPITGLITSMIRDYLLEIGFFNNTGAYAGHRRVTSLGNNPDVDTGSTPEDIWSGGGPYPWMTGATALEAVSTSAADTAAGTGARTISIAGLLATTYTELSQTITLNGLTPVAIPTSLFRINQVTMLVPGSSKVNVGDIIIRDAGGGTVRAIIPAGYGISRQSIFTVPAGYTLQIVDQVFSINRAAAAAHATISNFVQTALGTAFRMPFEIGISDAVPYLHRGTPGPTFTEKTDFCYRCTSVSANNTDVTAGFLGIMRLNGLT